MAIRYTDIFDDALLKIGNPPLDSGDVTSDLYVWLNKTYPRAVRQVLNDYDWKCQKKRLILDQDTVEPAFDYEYRYALPYDCVRVLSMYPVGYDYAIENGYLLNNVDDTDLDPGVGVIYIADLVSPSAPPAWVTATDYLVGDFVLESSTIYLCKTAHTSGTFSTDLAAVKWEAIQYRELDGMQSGLMEALTCKLAYMLTYKITQSQSLRDGLIKEYEWVLLRAKQTDAMQGTIEAEEEGSEEWVNAGR